MSSNSLTPYNTIPTFNDPKEEDIGKHFGKRRKCWLPAFPPFPTVFSMLSKREIVISQIVILETLSSANALNLVRSKILTFSKELTKTNNVEIKSFCKVQIIKGK